MADWSRYAVGGAKRPDSFTGLTPDFSSALSNMLAAAEKELGQNSLSITSAYRSPEKQAELYQAALKKYGSEKAARKWVAPPGKSMHNKGMAVDFAAAGGGLLRDPNSPQAQWLKKNASRFGLAVPMSWEPWQVELAGARGKPNPNQAIASDTMRVLGKQPKGLLAEPQATNNTESNMTPEQAPKGLLGSLGIQKMVEGAEGDAGQRFYNRQSFGDTMAALAPALGRMGVMGLEGPAQAVADRRFAQRDQEQKTSKTIEALSRMNTPQAKAALEYLSAGGDPVAALKMAFESTNNGVQSSSALRDRSGVVLTMRDGSIVVKTAGGETISGDAALKFVRDSEEAYAASEQSIYDARRTGTNEADIETGGTAAAAIEAGRATIKRGFEVYDKVNQTGASISTINSAIDAIDSGAKSGPVYNMLPKFDESSAALNSAMNQMGLDVISSVTFGALSAGEMNLAMETAVPRNLDPQELRSYLVKKRDAQMKARDALMAAARYLTTPGNTVTGWMDQQSQRPAVVSNPAPAPAGTGTISREDAFKTLTGGTE
jgi:hypothetical protein